MDCDEILNLIREIFVGINKTKKIELAIPENLMDLKYEGSEEHIEKLKKFLETLKPKENEKVKENEKPKENNSIAKKSKGLFYMKMFAGVGFTGFAGFLLYYLIKKRY